MLAGAVEVAKGVEVIVVVVAVVVVVVVVVIVVVICLLLLLSSTIFILELAKRCSGGLPARPPGTQEQAGEDGNGHEPWRGCAASLLPSLSHSLW